MTITVVLSVVRAQVNASARSSVVATLRARASHRRGVGDEVDGRLSAGRPDISQQVVERITTLADLQPVDHGVAAVVAQDDDHLVSRQHRRVEVAVEHQVRPVADEHDRVAGRGELGAGHRCAPATR